MVNKKINAHYDSVEKVIVIDDDNVQKGDYIDITHDSIANQIFKSQLTDDVKKQVISDYKDTLEYKNLIDKYNNDISSLKEKNESLNTSLKTAEVQLKAQSDNLQVEKDNAVLEFKLKEYKELEDKYKDLNNEYLNLKKDINVAKESVINNFKISDEYKNLELEIERLKGRNAAIPQEVINNFKLSDEYKNLEHEVERLRERNKAIPLEAVNEFKKSNEYLDIVDKANRRSKLNSKILGQELENYCQNEYDDKLQLFDNTYWSKTTIAKHGKKPDFIFKVYTDDKKDIEIASIVLEMKTSASNQSNNKIDQHLETLEFNRINFNAEFALLVTDLELDPENDFILKKASGWPRIFIVRPQYFTYVLILFKIIYEKSSEFATFLKKGSVDKEQILNFIDEFKQFKEDLFTKTVKNIQVNLKEIIDNANKIKNIADDILSSVTTIADKHLKTTENKINDYFKKIVNKENNFKKEN